MSIPTIERLMLFIKPADYAEWVTYPTVTMGEFGLLLSNCNPDMGEEKLFFLLKELDAMNGDVVDEGRPMWPKYKKLRSVLRTLDRATTQFAKEEEALYSDNQESIYSDKKRPMDFLVYFARKIGLSIPNEMADLDNHFSYEVNKEHPKAINVIPSSTKDLSVAVTVSDNSIPDLSDEVLSRFKSSTIFEAFNWVYDRFYKNKKTVAPASRMLSDIKDEFNQSQNKDQDKLYLSSNDCLLVNNLMRIIWGLK